MAENSNISWTDHTFNPWIGCAKVSPGCANCYAATQDNLRKWTPDGWGKGKPRKRTSAGNWNLPVRWNRAGCLNCGAKSRVSGNDGLYKCLFCGKRPRVFCASLADWLDDEVPIEWLADLLKLIHETPNLDWLLLTKRPENWRRRLEEVHAGMTSTTPVSAWLAAWLFRGHTAFKFGPTPPENAWIGTSVEKQEYADKRIPDLLKIPAKVRFLSCEPLLGKVLLDNGETSWLTCLGTPHCERGEGCRSFDELGEHFHGIDWVICGGESGPKRREMKMEWAQSLHDQCKDAGVAFFFKQVSAFRSGCLDGVPSDLLKQEFPK